MILEGVPSSAHRVENRKIISCLTNPVTKGFPGGSGKKSVFNARDSGLIPGSGRSPGEGNGNPLQYSWPENPMDRGAWQVAVHGVARVGHDLATKPPPPPEQGAGKAA